MSNQISEKRIRTNILSWREKAIEKLHEIGCYHDEPEIVKLREFDQLSIEGYNYAVRCKVCKKRVGLKDR